MKIEEREIWNVIGNTDSTEGRGTPVHLGSFLAKVDAEAWAEGRGVMGSKAMLEKERVKMVNIHGALHVIGRRAFASMGEAVAEQEADIRRSALAKLSAEERRVLGL